MTYYVDDGMILSSCIIHPRFLYYFSRLCRYILLESKAIPAFVVRVACECLALYGGPTDMSSVINQLKIPSPTPTPMISLPVWDQVKTKTSTNHGLT